MILTIALFTVLVAWVLFNLFAPLTVIQGLKPMHSGNLPGEIISRAKAGKVEFYRGDLQGGLAFTIWFPFRQIVVIDNRFLQYGSPDLIRFTLAHELGHCVLGHTFRRWFTVVTLTALIPAVRRYLDKSEHEADEYAEKLSCVSRSILRGAVVK